MTGYTPYARYYRPLVQADPVRAPGAVDLAGGPLWFSHAELLSRSAPPRVVPASAIPSRMLTCLTAPRAPIAGLMMDRVRLMGILNVTPDSFSDGGKHHGAASAVAHGVAMVEAGADIIDIGGESTRPGALEVPAEAEIARIEPTVEALAQRVDQLISIDTRKSVVAEVAVGLGATIVNDVSGFTFDPGLAKYCADHHLPVCIMHSPDIPETMQEKASYDHLLLDIYDFLGRQIARLEEVGIPRARIVIDPGIGFGKSLQHNLALLSGASIFHGHGVPLLIGASRKGFIRTVSQVHDPERRMPGSVAAALAAAGQGVQILRVHDVAETKQALRLWDAIRQGAAYDT